MSLSGQPRCSVRKKRRADATTALRHVAHELTKRAEQPVSHKPGQARATDDHQGVGSAWYSLLLRQLGNNPP